MLFHFPKIVVSGLILFSIGMFTGPLTIAQTTESPTQPAAASTVEPTEPPIDFERARRLFQQRQRGGQLTADEEAYVERALRARRGGAADRRPRELTPRDSIGLKPLIEMTADDRYQGEDGGLYGGGRNVPPEPHRQAAERELARIEPLDAQGQPARDGRIVFVSISMSNATQEFSRFKQIADRAPTKSDLLTIVDCAQGGQAMAEWAPADARPWSVAEQLLTRAQVSPAQVQVAWIKLANKGPRGDLQEHGRQLQRDTLAVIQNAKSRFPNLRVAYLSSRIYGGYARGALNPEPFAYESAFPARWLIQEQIQGEPALNFQPDMGPVRAPLLLWGPYLWADGVTPRTSDGLTYTREDLAADGTHPSSSGRDKVAQQMLKFFQTDPLAATWFTRSRE